MKMIKRALFTLAGVITIMAPLSLGVVAHADSEAPLRCFSAGPSKSLQGETEGCDLGVDKQVSVNGGAFVEADTSAEAAQGQVGDSVTWQITVSNTSVDSEMLPYGKVTVSDVLPSGVAFDSYTASAGTYVSNDWTFMLSGNLPATLTIVSHAITTGLFQNIAGLNAYDPCFDGCPGSIIYSDSNPDNDSNSAWFDPSAKPQVLADTTTASSGQVLADTGSTSSTIISLIAATIIASTIAVTLIGRTKRI